MATNISEDLYFSKNLSELEEKVKQYNLSKEDLMNIVYNNDPHNVDSAIPKELWKDHETFWYVMDYNLNPLGKLVHLGEALLTSPEAKLAKGINVDTDDLENYTDMIFIPTAYIKDVMTDEPLGKGNQYRLRLVFNKAKYASFEDLDDRSADSYKYNRKPIRKVHFDDISKMKAIPSEVFNIQ